MMASFMKLCRINWNNLLKENTYFIQYEGLNQVSLILMFTINSYK